MSGTANKYCSFCARSQDETALLIEGPAVYICDFCVRQGAQKMKENNIPLDRPQTYSWFQLDQNGEIKYVGEFNNFNAADESLISSAAWLFDERTANRWYVTLENMLGAESALVENEYVHALEHLAMMLRDTINGHRLKAADIPDDFSAFCYQLDICDRLKKESGL